VCGTEIQTVVVDCFFSGRTDRLKVATGGFEIFDDLLGENVRVRKVVGFCQAFVSEPEDIEAGLVAVDEFSYSCR
jgi:hypothetical protein